MPANPFRVTVIVPTLDREQALRDTLQCLFAQTYPRPEILVVDQTERHEPETEAFLLEAARAGRLRHLRFRQRGVTRARNAGIQHASGEIVLFCDDDVVLPPEWVACHVENFADPTIGAVTGQVLEPGETPADVQPVGRITPCGRVVNNWNSSHRMDVQQVKGGNLSVRKAAAQQAGLFDLRFDSPALFEEVDFAFRVRRLGYRIVFDPSASLRHLAWPRGGHQTRTHDPVSFYYHFLRLKTLFMLKNPAGWNWPCYGLMCLGRAVVTGLWQTHSWRAFYRLGVQALWDGYRLYRQI